MLMLITAAVGVILALALMAHLLVLPRLRVRSKSLMVGLLEEAGISVGKDIKVHDESMWLDWMANGMLGIGESYMARQWESAIPLDEVLTRLMKLPSSSKRRMFSSWNARLVALSEHPRTSVM